VGVLSVAIIVADSISAVVRMESEDRMDTEYLTDAHREIIIAAQEVISDFHTYGEVLQTDDNGKYSDKTAIGRLEKALQD